MEKSRFAEKFGYKSWLEMLFYSHCVAIGKHERWFITPTPQGWIAWIDTDLDSPVGWFSSFGEAQQFLSEMYISNYGSASLQ